MNEPTRITFNLTALTADQRDGFTCVVCERDLATGGPSVPVGTVPDGLRLLGGQVFACASHLTDDQRDGLACVVCGRDYLTEAVPTPHVPVAVVDGGQVFACTSHVQDATAGERDDAETRERAARRATWPGGEPAEVRAAAERIERIRALHRAQTIQVDDDGEAAEVTVCVHCDGLRELLDDEAAPVLYPCDTIRALDGTEAGQ